MINQRSCTKDTGCCYFSIGKPARRNKSTHLLLRCWVFIVINKMMFDCLECPYRLIVPSYYPPYMSLSRPSPIFCTENSSSVWGEEWSEVSIRYQNKLQCMPHHSYFLVTSSLTAGTKEKPRMICRPANKKPIIIFPFALG